MKMERFVCKHVHTRICNHGDCQCFMFSQKKCEQYWPEKLDDEMKTGENLCVTLKSSMPFVNYTIRKMSLRNVSAF